jgi:hypothetical protein
MIINNRAFNINPAADLTGADLSDADLLGANLTGANLTGANLTGAALENCYFWNALWKSGLPIKAKPIQILGLRWKILILDGYMSIGCQCHTFDNWKRFSDKFINKMDSNALSFWTQHKTMLLALCENGQQLY